MRFSNVLLSQQLRKFIPTVFEIKKDDQDKSYREIIEWH
jgi:hypothetical protein